MPSSKAAAQKKGANGGGKLAVGKAVKGAIFGLIVTVLSVLVLAIIVKQFGLSDGAIAAVNQAVKVVAIFITAFIAMSGADGRPGRGAVCALWLWRIFPDRGAVGQRFPASG